MRCGSATSSCACCVENRSALGIAENGSIHAQAETGHYSVKCPTPTGSTELYSRRLKYIADCADCQRVWHAYSAATTEHIRLESKLQIAATA